MSTKRLTKQKSYTLYPEQFAKLNEMFKRTYRNDSELVRFAIDRLYEHPDEWPIELETVGLSHIEQAQS